MIMGLLPSPSPATLPAPSPASSKSILTPEPLHSLWRVPPPPDIAARRDSNGDLGLVFEQRLRTTGVPLSLRMIQLKKKREKRTLDAQPVADPAGNAAWILASSLEKLHGAATDAATDREVARLSPKVVRENRCSVAYLFQRVLSSSPEIMLGVMNLTAEFMVRSVDGLLSAVGSAILEDVEISEEKRRMQRDLDRMNDCVKTAMFYERAIAADGRNSMILANYAQFLYEVTSDLDRAGEYFERAVRADPADAHALSRYAEFLWRGKGDVGGAEEMFLRALEAGGERNLYHFGNYICFLYETGTTDICCLLDENATGDK